MVRFPLTPEEMIEELQRRCDRLDRLEGQLRQALAASLRPEYRFPDLRSFQLLEQRVARLETAATVDSKRKRGHRHALRRLH